MRLRPLLSSGYGIPLLPTPACMQSFFGSGLASGELLGIGKISPMPAFYSGAMSRFGDRSRPLFSHSENGGGVAAAGVLPAAGASPAETISPDSGLSRDDIYRMAEQLRLEVSAFVRANGASDGSRDIFFQLAKIRSEPAMAVSDLADILRSVAEDFAELKESGVKVCETVVAARDGDFSKSGEKREDRVDAVSGVHFARSADKLPPDSDTLFHQDYAAM